ncbi:DUF3429 domain-containing protein [Qipengyuania sp. 1NDH17]|uniref:DUF3429 domain-containing protein n=1 Tax=Qipengyuania polymorpha TaxID=2867234 RepID=A0ABS7J3M6_9SPHN|nr:DUF3429 domain-containing protein [Qipengyuania polymorpha]MBX7459101.1 DUF3429 domain-containing protein [Qipengyuania polymorpha]
MNTVPRWPRLLGLAGLLPQLGALLVALLGPGDVHEPARALGALYAALIFTFLGGAWWGIAAGAPAAERRGGLAWAWVAAVVPSLLAFGLVGAWMLDRLQLEPLLVMLGGGLLMAVAVDVRLGSLAPRWWMQLRVPLSLILGAATIALGLA